MYSRKRGISGSTKPTKKTKQSWIRYSGKEVEQLVVKLAKAGNSTSKIGLILRDTYGIPDVKILVGKSISKILEENKLMPNIPEDLMALLKKQIMIMKHMETNKRDMPGKRGLQLTESKIKRLVKYYKQNGKLPQDWTYDPKRVKLLIE